LKAFFDTSVLVPVFYGDHPHHQASLAMVLAFQKRQAACAAHSLAEVYSTLTRLPLRPRISADQALLFLETMRERFTLIALDDKEYFLAIEEAAAAGATGGAVYDGLIARCALKAGAETIYTWNLSDFQRLGPAVASRVRTP
jgi:predicted nucleic acid-binding protein